MDNQIRTQGSELRKQRDGFWRAIGFMLLSEFCLLSSELAVPAAQAAVIDIYVTQNGSGGGTSCADARSAAWFNTAANWGTGTGQIGPGTTVHLCGTVQIAAGGTGLTFQGSGTPGNPITLKWETGATVSAPYCNMAGNGSGCIVVSTPANPRSYLVLDGL